MKRLSLLALLLTLASCQNPSRPLPLDSLVDRYFIEHGGLTSYGANLIGLYRRVGPYVDRISKGEKPADLSVQQPTKYKLVLNLTTAKALGVDVPPTLLVLADEVIE
jgi:putative tryptophan/tyrosine transport system substrate-binding protein